METEAVPTRSMNTGDVFIPITWADGGSPEQVHYNATDGGSASDAGVMPVPTDAGCIPCQDASDSLQTKGVELP